MSRAHHVMRFSPLEISGVLGPYSEGWITEGGDAVIREGDAVPIRFDDVPFPNAFSFTPVTGADTDEVYVSNEITIVASGPVVVSVSGGEFSLGAAYTTWRSAPVMVSSGQTIKVRLTSAPTSGAKRTCTLSAGGRSGSYVVTTA